MDDDKKRSWRRRNPFFDLFSEFDKMDEIMDKMMKDSFKDMNKFSEKPMVYGFSMKVGPDGKPKIREFGNVDSKKEKLGVKNAREPLVDLIEREKEIDILAEMPGVEKEDIDVSIQEDKVVIQVPDEFYKEIPLPCEVNEDKVGANYKNGVLTVTLEKTKSSKPGKHVQVK